MNLSSAFEVLRAARNIQEDAGRTGLGSADAKITRIYDTLITEPSIAQASRQLFIGGHYAQAVEQAFKCLNNVVKGRIGTSDDGPKLMRSAFSPTNPVLMISALKTQSEKDEQQGYMEMMAGSMSGIRNPRAHEHEREDPEQTALEMIVLANHLVRIARTARRKGARRQIKGTT